MSTSACWRNPQPGKLREQWERSGNTMQIRGEVYDEGEPGHRFNMFDEPRCHLVLSQARPGSDSWHRIDYVYFHPCDMDLKSHVRFVNDHVACFFMQWWHMVTVDGGETWQHWNVAEHLSGKAFEGQKLVEDVSVKPDGTGTMTLNPESVASHERLTLHTDNFGQQWKTQ